MMALHHFRSFLGRLGRFLLAVLLSPLRIGWKLLLSVRSLILFLLLLIAVLIAYYVLSDRYTPLTTEAYVQAYVVQVAPRVEGQVVRVHVRENQTVKKGDLLFEIDRRSFKHRVELLLAKRVLAVQQVAQLEADLVAAEAEDTRLVAEEDYARAVHLQEKEIFKQEATTDRKYLDALQKFKAAQAALKRSRRRSARPRRRWRRRSTRNMRWSRRSRRSSPRPGSTWNGRACTRRATDSLPICSCARVPTPTPARLS